MTGFVVTAEHSEALFQAAGLILVLAVLALIIWRRAASATRAGAPGRLRTAMRRLTAERDDPVPVHLDANDL